ncbi:zf-TFIIB domain-containing protein [bacterium]|nr:zf-TFIIB domain-containing protein [bacterium]
MHCPKCEGPLVHKTVEGTRVHECPECEGIWFGKDELKKVRDHADSDLKWMDFEILKHSDRFKAKAHKYECPGCGMPMQVIDYDQTKVQIDFCEQCQGIWLDKNELQRIIRALENELLTKSASDYVKATLKEAGELLTRPQHFISEWKDFTTLLRLLQYRLIGLNPKIHDDLVIFQHNPLNQ